MSIKAGLVGLPNVGKSTLFNALTRSNVPAENYPFCTIDPHVAITPVPDLRMYKLQTIYNSQKLIQATVSFVDIAGLVKGASSGEGLGNQFLSHIREVDLIIHVLRCFEDPLITHATSTIDPLDDYHIIMTELILKDIEAITKRLERLEHDRKKYQSQPAVFKGIVDEIELLQALYRALGKEEVATAQSVLAASKVTTIPLLSTKKYLIIANVAESELENNAFQSNPHYQKLVERFGTEQVIPISAKIEYELSQLTDEDATDMMSLVGLQASGLDTIIQRTYHALDLITFFTCGPKEIHAWPIRHGTTIRQAAGEIHSDLERGFICADVYNCQDILTAGSESALKDKGLIRREGQDYVVKDGDCIVVKFNV